MRPITRCSRHNGTRMAIGRSEAASSALSSGHGNSVWRVKRNATVMNTSSSPLMRIQNASGTTHVTTRAAIRTEHYRVGIGLQALNFLGSQEDRLRFVGQAI